MRRKKLTFGACALAITFVVSSLGLHAEATGQFAQLPAAGVAVEMGEGVAYEDMQSSIEAIVRESSKYTTNTSAVDLQTVTNDVSVVRADTLSEISSEGMQTRTLTSEAAPVTIVPVTVEGVQELTSEAVSESISETPDSITAQGIAVASQVESDTKAETVSELEEIQVSENLIPTEELEIPGANVAVKEQVPTEFENLVIAQVDDYVNVRSEANTEAEIVGKLYDDSVGTLIKEENGWYQIQSGNVTGYVKAEFCVTGDEAVALAEEVGTRIATVTTTTLKVRSEASLEASVIGLVPLAEELIIVEEVDGWVKISVEEGEGYVSTEYVTLRTDFVEAESKEEEEQRLAEEAAARAAAQQAAAQATSNNRTNTTGNTTAVPTITGDSAMGVSVAEYACQFVGNPYVYGGTSLTNGADCSGFVMSVYANFGVSLPHSSTADRTQGYAVDGLANAQPGDLVCYSGHVALYIGNNQIVHASSSKTGIIISNADYKKILAVRRIF